MSFSLTHIIWILPQFPPITTNLETYDLYLKNQQTLQMPVKTWYSTMKKWRWLKMKQLFLNFIFIEQHIWYSISNWKLPSSFWTNEIRIDYVDFKENMVSSFQKVLIAFKILEVKNNLLNIRNLFNPKLLNLFKMFFLNDNLRL